MSTAGARRLAAGFSWELAGLLTVVLFQLGYTACTGRLVSPAHFGAYATALAVMQGCGALMTGLAQLILKSQEATGPLVRRTLPPAAASGLALTLVLEAAAPLCALIWDAPHLVAFVRVVALQFLIAPVAVVCTAMLRRTGRHRAATALDCTGQLLGFATAVGLLIAGWNPLGVAAVWAVSQLIPAAGGLFLLRGSLRGARGGTSRALVGDLWSCARFALTQSVTYAAPMWIAAAVLTPVGTGQFSRALYFVAMLSVTLNSALQRTLVPALARLSGSAERLGCGVRDALVAASGLLACALGLLAALGPHAMTVLLGPGWGDAGALVPWFAVGLGVQVLGTLGHHADQARGADAAVRTDQWIIAAVMLGGLTLAGLAGSPQGLVLAHTAAAAAGHLAQLYRWRRLRLVAVRPVLAAYAAHAVLGVWIALAAAAGAGAAAGHPLTALVSGLLTGLAGALLLLPARRRIPALRLAAAHGLPITGRLGRRRGSPNRSDRPSPAGAPDGPDGPSAAPAVPSEPTAAP